MANMTDKYNNGRLYINPLKIATPVFNDGSVVTKIRGLGVGYDASENTGQLLLLFEDDFLSFRSFHDLNEVHYEIDIIDFELYNSTSIAMIKRDKSIYLMTYSSQDNRDRIATVDDGYTLSYRSYYKGTVINVIITSPSMSILNIETENPIRSVAGQEGMVLILTGGSIFGIGIHDSLTIYFEDVSGPEGLRCRLKVPGEIHSFSLYKSFDDSFVIYIILNNGTLITIPEKPYP